MTKVGRPQILPGWATFKRQVMYAYAIKVPSRTMINQRVLTAMFQGVRTVVYHTHEGLEISESP